MRLIEAGWPFFTMRAIAAELSSGPQLFGEELRLPWSPPEPFAAGIPIATPLYSDIGGVERALPTEVLPARFAASVGIWSVLLYVVRWSLSRLRQWRRESRGNCVACCHQLAGLPRCPECGNVAATG
jgi:hypothetical protein